MTYERDILTFSEFFNRYILDDPHKPLNSYQRRLVDMIYEGPTNRERPKLYICMGRGSRHDILRWLRSNPMMYEREYLGRILFPEEYIADGQLIRGNPTINFYKGESNA